MEGRVPPHNLDAEEAVISALLSTDHAYDAITGILQKEDFYRDANRVIFEAILTIIAHNKRADTILLMEELKRTKKENDAGGLLYINEILERHMSDNYNVEEHARIVADKARLRRLIDAGNKIVASCYSGEDETEAIIDDAERTVLTVTGVSNGDSSFSAIGEVVTHNVHRMYELSEYDSGLTGLSTGFRDLDRLTRGIQPSDLILVAARPSMGKTAFTLNLAHAVGLKQHKTVAFFSLEMSKEQLVGRVLANAASVPLNNLQSAQLDKSEWERIVLASQQMNDAPFYIDETPGLSTQQMRSKLRRLKAEHGLDLVIVDYIQLMQGRSRGNGDNRQQEISEISRNLKLIARELNVPVVALSQLSRSVEARVDKRPILSDLRESGSLEQDADIVMFLYREKYYDPETEKGDITELIVRKHRNGELGTINLMFQGEFTRFRDVAYNAPGEEG